MPQLRAGTALCWGDWGARKERHTGASMRPLPLALLPCNMPSPRIRRAALVVSCTAELASCRRSPMQSNPFPTREVLRCPHCRLVQFRSTIGLCRRCHHSLETLHIGLPTDLSPFHGAELPTEPLAKRIGAAVRDLRKERKLSQRQLANAMGTLRSHISKIERGLLVPSFQTLERATLALGIDIADLFRRSCQKTPGGPKGC